MAKHRSFRLTRSEPVLDGQGARLISSRYTRTTKYCTPLVTVGVYSLLAFCFLRSSEEPPVFGMIVIGIVVTGVCAHHCRVVLPMADEVWDHGDYLLAKRGRRHQQIWLREVENVAHDGYAAAPITLLTKERGPLGREVRFMPEADLLRWPMQRPRIYSELLERVVAARHGAASPSERIDPNQPTGNCK